MTPASLFAGVGRRADAAPDRQRLQWPIRVCREDTDATLKYHRPARLDDQLLVTTWLQEPGRACMTIGQQVRQRPDPGGAIVCDALIRVGWVSADIFKPMRIPTSIVKALS